MKRLHHGMLALALLGLSAAHGQDIDLKDLNVEARPLAELRPAASAPTRSTHWATAWVNHENNTFAYGDEVVFYVRAKRDVYITLFDVGTSGRVHVIYPNANQSDNFVRAGQTVRIPAEGGGFAITAGPPAGTELIKVIATERPLDVYRDATPVGPYRVLEKGPGEVARDLAVVLNNNFSNGWTSYDKVIRIVP